ncbi:MAG TPA: ATP synthase F0 subunit B [Desulfomonilaceae bacterium]|nr:ATP synthase F0 subunit B [Desulfomonilaceae bacterium]
MKATKVCWTMFCILVVFSCVQVASASSGASGESTWTPWMLLWRVINAVALVGLLIYFLRKPLAKFFSERKAQISKDLEDAKQQRERAEALVREYEAKLAGMEKELEKLRDELRKSADAESAKITINAEKMSASMVEAAKMAAEQEVRKAKAALKSEAVALAVQLAETLIREKINDEDRKKIVKDYLDKVGGTK